MSTNILNLIPSNAKIISTNIKRNDIYIDFTIPESEYDGIFTLHAVGWHDPWPKIVRLPPQLLIDLGIDIWEYIFSDLNKYFREV